MNTADPPVGSRPGVTRSATVTATARRGVVLQGITKSFGASAVLKDVTLELVPGTVHGLVGENGAGKSTLMKVLSGVTRPDAGRLLIDGQEVTFKSPADALGHQISLISQELATVPARSVLDNVFLGSWAARHGWVRPRRDRALFRELCDDVGFVLDPDRSMGTLTVAEQQQVEVLRAVSRGSRVLVMDEPTAVLTDGETAALLGLVRRLAASGVTVVLISHFLEEVLDVCDTVTVLRDGVRVLSEPAAMHTPGTLVQAMVGRRLEVLFPDLPDTPDDSPVVLETRGLTRGDVVRDVDLAVRAGEIVGLAGLVGSGRSELARLVFGADRPDAGSVWIGGRRLRPGSPRAAMCAGVAMVPESRKEQGLHLVRSIRDNATLASLDRTSRFGWRRPARERRLAHEVTRRLDVRAADVGGAVWTLSGGNQQKVLFAKWIARRPRLLILDEPTRGVDVTTKLEIHRLICELARSGMAVLLISSELDEVLGLSHRIAVLRRGRITTVIGSAEADPQRVLAAAFADTEE